MMINKDFYKLRIGQQIFWDGKQRIITQLSVSFFPELERHISFLNHEYMESWEEIKKDCKLVKRAKKSCKPSARKGIPKVRH